VYPEPSAFGLASFGVSRCRTCSLGSDLLVPFGTAKRISNFRINKFLFQLFD
jgi:hypothetical protein